MNTVNNDEGKSENRIFSDFIENNTLNKNVAVIGSFMARVLSVDIFALAVIEKKDTVSFETAFWSGDGLEQKGIDLCAFLQNSSSEIVLRAYGKSFVCESDISGVPKTLSDDFLLFTVIMFTQNISVILVSGRSKQPWQAEEQKTTALLYPMLESLFAVRVLLKREQYVTGLLNTILNQSQANVYITDIKTSKILFMNDTMKKTFNIQNPEGKICWKVLQRNMTEKCAFCPVKKLLKSKTDLPLLQWEEINTITGRVYHNFDSLIYWIDGSRVHVQQSIDITDLKFANTDELTHMLARRPGKTALEETLARAKVEKTPVTVCLYDINLLKRVNDHYGHAQGDNLIASIAEAVRGCLRKDEYAFRLSGDEFVIVFTSDQKDAQTRLKAVQKKLKNTHASYEMSFCYGLVETATEQDLTIDGILLLADERMYIQKRRFHILENDRRLKSEHSDTLGKQPFSYDAEKLYGALVQSTDSFLYVCNMKTGVFRYPRAMVEEFALPGEIVENAAAVWGSKVHKNDRAIFREANQEIIDGRTDVHCVEYRVINAKGEWIRVRCRGHLERDENGDPVLFAGFITKLGTV